MHGGGKGFADGTIGVDRTLAAGVVAYNDEALLPDAVRSLFDQELPPGVTWGECWVVVSASTDRTVEVARALEAQEPRVRLLIEPDRGGKARALREVLRRASGDALVLLNSDARAEPGAIRNLLNTAAGRSPPFAVMARPVVSPDARGPWAETFEWMWELHHEFHADLLSTGCGRHLSDELLLLSLPEVPPLPDGVINDGSYFAVWLAQHGGTLLYSPDARVSIQTPATLEDHLHQRRRIRVGNAQVRRLLGGSPSTIGREFNRRPVATVRLVKELVSREHGFVHFARLASWEIAAQFLADWDQLVSKKDHVRWRRIYPPASTQRPSDPSPHASPVTGRADSIEERRVALLLRVAHDFSTGIPLADLRNLLPVSAPASEEALAEWLRQRPGLARLDERRVSLPEASVGSSEDRVHRGRAYQEFAGQLLKGPLAFAEEVVRCVAITGSAAYGEPELGDDLDLFVVVRSGALWWFLARAYGALLIERLRAREVLTPPPCLNYVLEDSRAPSEFTQPADLLIAREALSAQVVFGDEYYRGLLSAASWMASAVPRLYGLRTRAPGSTTPQPAGWRTRLLNVVVYPWLAAYLHALGLFRNHRLDRLGLSGRSFRTTTGWRRFALASRRFDELRARYDEDRCERARFEASGGTNRVPLAR